jgi:hypothetical protein
LEEQQIITEVAQVWKKVSKAGVIGRKRVVLDASFGYHDDVKQRPVGEAG